MFYIQSKERVIGNEAVWWRKGDAGYTASLDEAAVYTEIEALERVTERDIAVPVSSIKKMVRPTVPKCDVDNFVYCNQNAVLRGMH
jgi:hypothetical protein